MHHPSMRSCCLPSNALKCKGGHFLLACTCCRSAAFLDDANLGLVQEGAEQLAQVLPTAAPQPGAASTSLGGTSSSLGGASGSQQQAAESQSLTAGGASSAPDVAAAAAVAVAAVPAAAASRPAAAPAPQPTQPQAQQLQQQQPAPPPRGLQVLLPVTPDTNLPDYFFERTGADVKAEFMRLYKQRQESQVCVRALCVRAHECVRCTCVHTRMGMRWRLEGQSWLFLGGGA